MADKWSSIIENGKSGHSAVIDVNSWLEKAVLDACVLVLVLVVRGLRATREPIAQQDWCWGFRVRVWRVRRCG